MPEWLAAAMAAGVLGAVGSYAAVSVNLAWLRRDVDWAHVRIDRLPCLRGRRAYDQCSTNEEGNP